jgi:hypothetical protein
MRWCAIKEVFHAIERMKGLDPLTVTISATERARVCELVNERMIEGWENAFWPELMKVEQRWYREVWSSTEAYAEDDEVCREGTDGEGRYYRSKGDGNTNHDPLTDTTETYWEDVTLTMRRTIDFEQRGESVIGKVDTKRAIFSRDIRVHPTTRPIQEVHLYEASILVEGSDSPAHPWVRFLPPAPEFSWTDWDVAAGYAIGDVAYYGDTGHAYRALLASTGKNPEQETDYWEAVYFPRFLKGFVVHAVRADDLMEDQGRAKEENKAQSLLELAKGQMIDMTNVDRQVIFQAV